MDTLFDVTDRLALVTGSSRGIGYALAYGLLLRGATVVSNGCDQEALVRAADTLQEATGRRPHLAEFDVTDEVSVDAHIELIESELGPIEIAVNNAVLFAVRR